MDSYFPGCLTPFETYFNALHLQTTNTKTIWDKTEKKIIGVHFAVLSQKYGKINVQEKDS